MNKIFLFLLIALTYSFAGDTMEKKPYHHLSDGTFRNPEGSPIRDVKFKSTLRLQLFVDLKNILFVQIKNKSPKHAHVCVCVGGEREQKNEEKKAFGLPKF